jgi:hypothetical protein
MNSIMPKPLRDIVEPYLTIKANNHNDAAGSRMLMAAQRVGLASAALAFHLFSSHSVASGAILLAGVVSVPSLLAAAGSYGLYLGAAKAIGAAFSGGSFLTVGYGLGIAACSWCLLENYTFTNMGILEGAMKELAINNGGSLENYLKNN